MKAKRAIITFLQKFVSPSQHVPGIKLVIQQESGKKFDFGHTIRFPYPSDGPFRVNFPKTELIISARSVAVVVRN
jgi:hypothetical protein